MSTDERSNKTRRVEVRFPERLAEAVEDRAEQLGVSTSAVVREAVARQLATPVDKRAACYVHLWLEGQV